MNDFETSDQDHLLAGPGSKTKLDPETARIRDAIIESFRDRPISEINSMAKKVLSIETDPVKRLGMLAARVYLLRHRIMNLKMGADDIDRLGAANLQDQQAKGDTGAVEESSSEQSGESDWIRVRMLEEAEMNGMRFFEGIVVDVRKEDATKLVESGQAQIVAEQPEDKPDEPKLKRQPLKLKQRPQQRLRQKWKTRQQPRQKLKPQPRVKQRLMPQIHRKMLI